MQDPYRKTKVLLLGGGVTENQQKLLDEWLEFLKTSQEALEKREADIKDFGRWIPPVTSETLNDAQNIVNTMKALCDAIVESGECRDFRFFLG